MLKNIVFDLGNVLVKFNPIEYMLKIGIEQKDVEILNDLIFKNQMWNEFDRGTITIENYCKKLKKDNAQYGTQIDKIFAPNWEKNLFLLNTEVAKFLEETSKKYKIYILSNVSEQVLKYIKTLDFWKYVTGGTYSYTIKACKPEKEIYEVFLKQNNLIPEKCFFLDDKAENIKAAEQFGMKGIVFDGNVEKVKKKINNFRK